MKKKSISIVALLFILAVLYVSASDRLGNDAIELHVLKPLPVHPNIERTVGHLLSKTHYKKRNINNTLSSEMFDFYLDLLDKNRFYFLQADIDEFERYRFELDDAIKAGDLTGAFYIFNRFQERLNARHEFVNELLEKDFDFTIDEYFDINREDAPWAKTELQMEETWSKRIKNEILGLRLAGKEPGAAIETLKKRYHTILKRISQTDSEDVFNLYLNAFAATFDPHTSYMSPKMSEDFTIKMSLSLEGIGATLQMEDEYTKVIEIIPGGPADKSGLLHPNDRILGVGEGDDEEMVDVIGWRIDDVVQLIRGPKGAKVRLQILPAEAPIYSEPKVIEIIRDKVNLDDRKAKSEIQEIEYHGKKLKIGVIEIPDFYLDYEAKQNGDPDYASTSRDVQKLLADLKIAAVDGIIIDLRNNGGGFLSEAIYLTGLFIEKGPMVQVRDSQGNIASEYDNDSNIYYSGPIAVLVNRLSASASEIFAAAIQDYRRGIVVGSRTFGKGTVQNIIPLDRVFPGSKERLGQVKLTIAKFYRVNGSSTQHVGVTPDIQFPSRYEAMEIGESTSENALLWDRIKETEFTPSPGQTHEMIPELVKKFEERISGNPEFRYLKEGIKLILEQKENTLVSLQEEKRKQEKDAVEALDMKRKKEREQNGNEEEDPLIMETEHILGDYIWLTSTGLLFD